MACETVITIERLHCHRIPRLAHKNWYISDYGPRCILFFLMWNIEETELTLLFFSKTSRKIWLLFRTTVQAFVLNLFIYCFIFYCILFYYILFFAILSCQVQSYRGFTVD